MQKNIFDYAKQEQTQIQKKQYKTTLFQEGLVFSYIYFFSFIYIYIRYNEERVAICMVRHMSNSTGTRDEKN